MALLAATAVQLPFIVALLMSRGVACRHCREVWLTKWYSLPAFPLVFFSGFSRLKGASMPPWAFDLICAHVVLGMIAVVFLLCRWNRKWKAVLVGTFLFFCLIAVLAHAIIAA